MASGGRWRAASGAAAVRKAAAATPQAPKSKPPGTAARRKNPRSRKAPCSRLARGTPPRRPRGAAESRLEGKAPSSGENTKTSGRSHPRRPSHPAILRSRLKKRHSYDKRRYSGEKHPYFPPGPRRLSPTVSHRGHDTRKVCPQGVDRESTNGYTNATLTVGGRPSLRSCAPA